MEQLKDQFLAHAEQVYPKEACGLVVCVDGREQYWPCQNLAGDDESARPVSFIGGGFCGC